MSHDGNDHGSMNGGSMGGMGSSSDMMMMHMSFYWGKDAIILFSGWPKDSLGAYILALFVVLLMAFVTEALSTVPSYKMDKSPVAVAFRQAVVYAIRTGLAYMVMLAAMSFNVGIFIAAVVGHAIGCYFFKARAVTTANQNGAVQRS